MTLLCFTSVNETVRTFARVLGFEKTQCLVNAGSVPDMKTTLAVSDGQGQGPLKTTLTPNASPVLVRGREMGINHDIRPSP